MERFAEVWQQFHQALHRYIQSKVANAADAEDILQNVFLKLYQHIDKLNKPSAVKPWLYTVSKRAIIDYYRQKKPLDRLPEQLAEQPSEAENMNQKIVDCLIKILFALPDKYKAVYSLYEHDGAKHKEIAQQLGITESASKVRLKRARDMLKAKIIECCQFEVDVYGNIIDYTNNRPCEDC